MCRHFQRNGTLTDSRQPTRVPLGEAAAMRRRREDRLLADNLELRTSEKLSHEIFRFAQVGLCLAREDGTIVRVNPEFGRIFGYDPRELEGRPLTKVLPGHLREDASE